MATDNLKPLRADPPQATPQPSAVFRATVRAVTGRSLAIEHAGRTGVARRAASCLLAPRAHDVVLCVEIDDGAYVLAVLERAGESAAATELEVDGELILRARDGSIRLEATEDVELSAGRVARLRGKVLALVADEGTWVGRDLRLLGEQLTLDATRIRQVSSFAERIAESLKERFGSAYRDVEDAEHVRAGSLHVSLRHLLRYHADTAVMTAKKLIKLNGDQIHLG